MNSTIASSSYRGRFQSIDLIRGAIMILMALDHVRWFFTNISAYQPETLADTNIWLFLTRWVTHYCAPGFFLVAGLGIFLYSNKIQDKTKLIKYLLSRGIMLVILELTIVGFSWIFTPGYSFGGVIWALGWSFIFMAGLVYLPWEVLLALALVIVFGHNLLLDGVVFTGTGWDLFFWRFFYSSGGTSIPGITEFYYMLFSLIPWLAIMILGYALGTLYLNRKEVRKKTFIRIGLAAIAGFIVLRLTNFYGNPELLWISNTTSGMFSVQPEFWKTVINFLNVEKYPPSLQFVLMTLGPIFLWLGLSKVDDENAKPTFFARVMILFGRVPLFFYICHLYLIHLLALVITFLAGQPYQWVAFGADPNASRPEGYGFDLWFIHVMWGVSVAILYLLCMWYENYKRTHSYGWLKYF